MYTKNKYLYFQQSAHIVNSCLTVWVFQSPFAVLVLLLQSPAGVGEPRGNLRQCHLGDDCQHDLLGLGRIRIFAVFVQPRLQGTRWLAAGVLPSNVDDHAPWLQSAGNRSVRRWWSAELIQRNGAFSLGRLKFLLTAVEWRDPTCDWLCEDWEP